MSEPILEETTTDIDGTDAGELEIEASASLLRSRSGGAFDLQLSPELELLLTRRLGAKVEPVFERSAPVGARPTNSGGIGGGLSWKILQDFDHDFHMQVEVSGVTSTEAPGDAQPGEPSLPFSFDLRSGLRRGPITLRTSLGVSAGAESAHLPVRGSAVVLTDFEPSGTFGFWGVEIQADGARPNPFVVALDLVPNFMPAGLPFALGFVLPYSVGANGHTPSYGFLVRLFVESAREREFARAPE
jgi:hypothetical protein